MEITEATVNCYAWPRPKPIPNGLMLEYYRETVDPFRGQIFVEEMVLDDDGCVAVPDRPDLGITPNYDLLEQHRVA